MSEHKKLNPEQQFVQWLENQQNEPTQLEFDENLVQDDAEQALWQQRVKTAQALQHQVSLTAEQAVPDWDRAATFDTENIPWWQWRGLPAMSMAFSIFAIALVLFKVELVMQDDGLLLSFAGNRPTQMTQEQQQSEITALVDAQVEQKLQSFASEQQVVLANYVADIKVQQQQSNLQLASYIMGASRQERKEDISDFIQYINDQRNDENLDTKFKIERLEQAINLQNIQKTNYQPSRSDGLGMTTKPASWASEE